MTGESSGFTLPRRGGYREPQVHQQACPMNTVPAPHGEFEHVRAIMGVVSGLAMARLMSGLAGFVQHPTRQKIYVTHVLWAIFMLLGVMHFWWFEFALGRTQVWTFELYVFLIGYAAAFYFTCALLFPDRLEEYGGYRDYFHSRQAWFYGFVAGLALLDMVDSRVKGAEHFQSLGPLYPYRQGIFFLAALLAIRVRDRRFHLGFVILALVAEVWWILSHFRFLD